MAVVVGRAGLTGIWYPQATKHRLPLSANWSGGVVGWWVVGVRATGVGLPVHHRSSVVGWSEPQDVVNCESGYFRYLVHTFASFPNFSGDFQFSCHQAFHPGIFSCIFQFFVHIPFFY